mgnify:CR=1 FL=1
MVVAYDLAKSSYEVFDALKVTTDEAIRKGYKVIGMSASSDEVGKALVKEIRLVTKDISAKVPGITKNVE